MIYEAERRLTFRLIHGLFVKKKSDGVYPPAQQTQNTHNTEKGGSDEKRKRFDNHIIKYNYEAYSKVLFGSVAKGRLKFFIKN
jgi:hypothetical protein